MPRKTYVLDTNVLLHDPLAIEKFQGNDVVIPLVVLEELDKLKQFTDELGKNARFVLRYIDQLTHKGNLHEGVAISEKDIQFKVLVELKNMGKKDFLLPLDTPGNRILLAAFQLKHMELDVVLVSKDFFMRVKAGAIGIEAQDYESLKQSYENLYKGITEIEVTKKEIDQFFTSGFLQTDKNLSPNEYCILNTPGGESSSIGWFNGKKNRLEPLLGYDRDIWGITPLNTEQRCALDLLLREDIHLVTLIGPAGTGKTLLALACGLKTVFDEDRYRKLLISRPIMPLGRDIGYLPGTKEEKLYHWMQPIYDNLEFLCEFSCGEGNGSETKRWISESKKFEMEAVTYIRGRTLPKMYIIIDEAQNLTPHEVKTIISRAGHGTKVILTGDPTQIDNPYLDKDSNALTYVVGRFKDHALFGHIFLEKTERSELASLAAEVLL
ncbi:MAG: PhoH family protein [Simkaniaceae bacterium]